MKRIAAIYARVSTSDGKQDYNRQVSDLTTLIKQHGYKQIEVFAESVSGYKKSDNRPKLTELLEKVEQSPTDFIIYTTEISRIGRNPTETRRIIDHLTDIGVPVYIQSIGQSTIEPNGKRNFIMNIILQVLIEYANLEAETFKTRSMSGLLKSAKEGKVGGGASLPYGYQKGKDKMMIVNPKEAKVIEQIFNLYTEGNGIKVISNILNQQKTPTRSNISMAGKTMKFKIEKNADEIKWSDKQVHDILNNTIYKGQRRYKGELLSSPIIIDTDKFDECSHIMKSKSHRNYLTVYTYLLKDLCKCGKCWCNYFAKFKPTEGGDRVYICAGRLKGQNCGNAGINISLIESAIYNEFIGSDEILKFFSNTKELKHQLEGEITKLTQNLNTDEKVLVTKRKENERLLDVYLSGDITISVFTSKQAKIEKEIQMATERVEQIKQEIKNKQKGLLNLVKSKTTRKILEAAANNRTELATIYRQLIWRVIIRQLDNNNVLAVIYLSVNGFLAGTTIKLLLDISGIRRKPIEYRYKSLGLKRNEPPNKNGIGSKTQQQVLKEFEKEDWQVIKKILTVQ